MIIYRICLLFCCFFPHRGYATCPNSCSGHGSCGSSNKCTCDEDWNIVGDCSLRACPTGTAWADKASAANTAHASSSECSNRGVCDYSKGVCSCFTGFTGIACQRSACPNDCSSHGICKSMESIALQYGPDTVPGTGGDGVGPVYSNWEKQSLYMCICDKGFFGPDCSLKMCPKNDDPLTTGQGYRTITITTGASGGTLAGSIVVSFNGQSATLNANADSNSDSTCAAAFTAMENVKTATCTKSGVTTEKGAVYTIVFQAWTQMNSENNVFSHTGNPPLTSFTCDISGVTAGTSPSCSIADSVATNVIEHVYCSNRGICDFTTGDCTCFSDYQGFDCSIASNVPDDIDTNDGFVINPTGSTYTGKVLNLKTTKAGATDFKFLYAEANSVNIFDMDGQGNTNWHTGNVDIKSGTLKVSTGQTITTGGLTISNGGADVTNSATGASVTGATIAATSTAFTGTALQAASATAAGTGFYLFKALSSTSTSQFDIRGDGLTTIRSGGLSVADGGATITDDQAATAVTTIQATDSSTYTGSVLISQCSRAASSLYNLIEGKANGNTQFKVDGTGKTTITNGGIVVTDGGGSITSSATGTAALTVHSTGSLTSDVINVKTTITGTTSFNLIHAEANSATKFTVDGTGKTTAAGGLVVSGGGVTISATGASITGGLTVASAGLVVSNTGATISGGGIAVTGSSSVSSATTNAPSFQVHNTGTLTDDILLLKIDIAAASTFNFIESTANSVSMFSVDGDGKITAAGGLVTTGLIQTTLATASTGSGSGALKVTGGAGIGGNIYAGGIIVVEDTTDSTSTGSGSLRTMGGLGVAKDAFFGVNMDVVGTVTCFSLTQDSDIRLKKNIRKLETVDVELILGKLQPVVYEWKKENAPEGDYAGLIAQEVEKVLPTLVRTNKNGYKSVNYVGLIPYLLEMNAKLLQRIEKLEEKVGRDASS